MWYSCCLMSFTKSRPAVLQPVARSSRPKVHMRCKILLTKILNWTAGCEL